MQKNNHSGLFQKNKGSLKKKTGNSKRFYDKDWGSIIGNRGLANLKVTVVALKGKHWLLYQLVSELKIWVRLFFKKIICITCLIPDQVKNTYGKQRNGAKKPGNCFNLGKSKVLPSWKYGFSEGLESAPFS